MTSLVEHILVNYRWIFVIYFLLPLSFVYDIFYYARNWLIFKLNSAPHKHKSKVKEVQRQVKVWRDTQDKRKMCTARPTWQTMSFRHALYKSSMYNVKINMIDILEMNIKERYVRVEPMVTIGQLTSVLIPLGWTIPIVPELEALTIGGIVNGTGIESSSHKFGIIQHICKSFEVILPDGSLVKCSRDQEPELFYSIPWSHGTIGFLIAIELYIIPAEKYVKLEYFPVNSLDEACTVFKREVFKSKENQFVEGLMYDKDRGVIMTGNMAATAEASLINPIGKWYKPWFFKHVEKKLKGGKKVEYIPIKDYYHRHSRSIFWEMQDIVPFGNNILFRYLLGWLNPPKVSLLKLTQTGAIKKLYEQHHLIQDMWLPIEKLQESISYFDEIAQVYPLWLCPMKLTAEPGLVNSRSSSDRMYVDVGLYGVPKVKFDAESTTKKIEEFGRKIGGYQMLYADCYATRKEFRETFDHSLYDRVREKYGCNDAFPEVYDKVKKTART